MKLTLKLQESDEHEIVGSSKDFDAAGGTIGRLPSCLWQLNDNSCSLSREHAKIYSDNGLFFLQDNSSNGVFVNDSVLALGKMNAYPLTVGDKLAMGEYVFKVESIETDRDIENKESIPQLDIQLNPVSQSEQAIKSESLSELFAEDDSLIKTNLKDGEHLFSASSNNELEAKNGDDIMFDLTGDSTLSEDRTKQHNFVQSKDTHDMETGSAFKMPEVIPDDFNFTQSNDNKENKPADPELEITKQKENFSQKIPDNFIPDIVSIEEMPNVQANNEGEQLIPDDFFSELQNTTSIREVNYKNALNELFLILNMNIDQYNEESLNSIIKKMAHLIKQYSIEHNIDLALHFSIDKEKG